MASVSEETLSKMYEYALNEDGGGVTRFAGMSYEDGIKAVIDVIEGNITLEDFLEG